MGFLSDLNRKRKKVTKKILNPVVKGFSKISDKFIPNELRFLAPYAAGIGTLMLPPGIGPAMRGLYAAGLNAAGQIGADETAAFISQYLRLDQIGANVLASQLESLQEQLFTADPDEQEAIKQQIADINNQIKIRGSGQSTGTTTNNDIPYGSLLE